MTDLLLNRSALFVNFRLDSWSSKCLLYLCSYCVNNLMWKSSALLIAPLFCIFNGHMLCTYGYVLKSGAASSTIICVKRNNAPRRAAWQCDSATELRNFMCSRSQLLLSEDEQWMETFEFMNCQRKCSLSKCRLCFVDRVCSMFFYCFYCLVCSHMSSPAMTSCDVIYGLKMVLICDLNTSN